MIGLRSRHRQCHHLRRGCGRIRNSCSSIQISPYSEKAEIKEGDTDVGQQITEVLDPDITLVL